MLLARGRRTNPMGLLSPVVIVDGQVAGTWKRGFEKECVKLAVKLHRPLTRAEKHSFGEAARQYGAFVGRTVKPPRNVTPS